MIYSINGNRLSNAYNKGGQIVSPYNKDGERIGHEITSKYTRSLMFTLDLPTGTQGIACDSITQTIAQLYTGNIYLINVSDGSYSHIASSFNLGHGHTGQFAPTKTAEQEYPFLYVSGPNLTVENNEYTCLLMVECTSNSATMKKIYAIPADEMLTGTCQVCIDFENEVVYHVAASTYYGTADYTYIYAWDMTDIELLEGASYSPTPQEGIYALKTKLFEFQIPLFQKCKHVHSMMD